MTQEILRRALDCVDRGMRVAMASVVQARGSVPGKPGARMLVPETGPVEGTVGGAGLEEKVKDLCREALKTGIGGIHHFDLMHYKEGALDSLCGGSVEVVVEVLLPRPHVLICGGGHVGREVARLCDQLDYAYSVLDDRPEFSDIVRFPHARNRFVSMPEAFFKSQDLTAFTHLLVVGYSHRIDTDILFHAAERYRRWIGVIASATKKREMIRRVRARGISEELLSNVECPVGLSIGAVTPAEIAVAILGSIIRTVKGTAPVASSEELPTGTLSES